MSKLFIHSTHTPNCELCGEICTKKSELQEHERFHLYGDNDWLQRQLRQLQSDRHQYEQGQQLQRSQQRDDVKIKEEIQMLDVKPVSLPEDPHDVHRRRLLKALTRGGGSGGGGGGLSRQLALTQGGGVASRQAWTTGREGSRLWPRGVGGGESRKASTEGKQHKAFTVGSNVKSLDSEMQDFGEANFEEEHFEEEHFEEEHFEEENFEEEHFEEEHFEEENFEEENFEEEHFEEESFSEYRQGTDDGEMTTSRNDVAPLGDHDGAEEDVATRLSSKSLTLFPSDESTSLTTPKQRPQRRRRKPMALKSSTSTTNDQLATTTTATEETSPSKSSGRRTTTYADKSSDVTQGSASGQSAPTLTTKNKYGNKMFSCDICDYTSKYRNHMKRHYLRHSEEKPFKCHLCTFEAKERYRFNKHMVSTHPAECGGGGGGDDGGGGGAAAAEEEEEKRFKCGLCPFETKERYRLRRHWQQKHPGGNDVTVVVSSGGGSGPAEAAGESTLMLANAEEKPFKCTICPFETKAKYRLNKHWRQVHPDGDGGSDDDYDGGSAAGARIRGANEAVPNKMVTRKDRLSLGGEENEWKTISTVDVKVEVVDHPIPVALYSSVSTAEGGVDENNYGGGKNFYAGGGGVDNGGGDDDGFGVNDYGGGGGKAAYDSNDHQGVGGVRTFGALNGDGNDEDRDERSKVAAPMTIAEEEEGETGNGRDVGDSTTPSTSASTMLVAVETEQVRRQRQQRGRGQKRKRTSSAAAAKKKSTATTSPTKLNLSPSSALTASNEKWFFCENCDYKSKYRSHVVRHNSYKHSSAMLKCHLCRFETKERYKLTKHLAKHVAKNDDERPGEIDDKRLEELVADAAIVNEGGLDSSFAGVESGRQRASSEDAAAQTDAVVTYSSGMLEGFGRIERVFSFEEHKNGGSLGDDDVVDGGGGEDDRSSPLKYESELTTFDGLYEDSNTNRTPGGKIDDDDYSNATEGSGGGGNVVETVASANDANAVVPYEDFEATILKPHRCHICTYRTKYKSHLSRHLLKHSSVRLFSCEICGKKTKELAKMRIHKMTHNVDNPFRCELCPFKTKAPYNLTKHMKRIHYKVAGGGVANVNVRGDGGGGEGGFGGESAGGASGGGGAGGAGVGVRGEEGNDELVIVFEKRFRCDACTFATDLHYNFKRHLLTHAGVGGVGSVDIPIFKCIHCTYETPLKDRLTRHLRIHDDVDDGERFKCSFCPFETKVKYNLIRHRRIHEVGTGMEQDYKCDFCDYGSVVKANLERHVLLTHGAEEEEEEGVVDEGADGASAMGQSPPSSSSLVRKSSSTTKRFQCDFCSYTTVLQYNLKRHSKIHDDDDDEGNDEAASTNLLRCQLCSYVTDVSRDFQSHLLEHHREEEVEEEDEEEGEFEEEEEEGDVENVVAENRNREKTNFGKSKNLEDEFLNEEKKKNEKMMKGRQKKQKSEFECLICSFVSKIRHNLERHLILKHGGGRKKQRMSQKQQKAQKRRRKQQQRQRRQRLFHCKVCPFQARLKFQLKQHLRLVHHEEGEVNKTARMET